MSVPNNPKIVLKSIFFFRKPKLFSFVFDLSLDGEIKSCDDQNDKEQDKPSENGQKRFFENEDRVPFVFDSDHFRVISSDSRCFQSRYNASRSVQEC